MATEMVLMFVPVMRREYRGEELEHNTGAYLYAYRIGNGPDNYLRADNAAQAKARIRETIPDAVFLYVHNRN